MSWKAKRNHHHIALLWLWGASEGFGRRGIFSEPPPVLEAEASELPGDVTSSSLSEAKSSLVLNPFLLNTWSCYLSLSITII